MRTVLPVMAGLAARLGAGETLGPPEEEGYLPRALRANVRADRSGAARALDLALARLGGEAETEVAPTGDRVPPPPAIADVAGVTVALVTEAGCVPQGNPDRLLTRHAHTWLRYPITGVASLGRDRFESVHAGFDTTVANADPNRLVPLDAARALASQGRIGALHEEFFTTSGVDTPVATAAKFGQEMAEEFRAAGVQAVILTGT
jgi:glycine reductase